MLKHFLSIAELTPAPLWNLLEAGLEAKKRSGNTTLGGKGLALLFEKPSLRTRVSFEVAMRQLGGYCIYLSPAEVGLGKREAATDVARVLSRYVDGIAARTFSQGTVEELAAHATVPVINALSNEEHPCQALADLLTVYERKGRLKGTTIAFIGDANNVANSLMLASAMVGAHFRIASPPAYGPRPPVWEKAQSWARSTGAIMASFTDPREAAAGADVLYTDVWASMGQEGEAEIRRAAFAGYQVNPALVALAQPDALLMHPLPAHYGEEVSLEVAASPQWVAWEQAENRLHAQKALLCHLLKGEETG